MVSGERSGIGIISPAKEGGEMVEDSTRTKEEFFNKNNFGNQVTANEKYKDSVFRKLFHQKKELLELYNALNNSNYTREEDLEIVTLDSSLFLSMRNDLAFILDFRMHLCEHQSTPSPNMPLRDLIYVAQEYKKVVSQKSLFSEKPIRIPAPRFVVFYNGINKQPERQLLKLSDLYMTSETEPMLELQVLVLNINEGYNTWLKEKCRSMYEYMQYVDRVRYYRNQKEYSLLQAIETAIDECIKEGILAEFLSKDRSEAVMISMYEHNEEEEWRKFREAEREYGFELGMEQALYNLMKNQGMTEEEARIALGLKQ